MLKLAIDLGTAVTKIYKLGSGVILSEATCVTVQKGTEIPRAYGNEAKRLLGKESEQTEVVFPVREQEIVSEKLAGALLEHFLKKVGGQAFSVEALFCVPCGMKSGPRDKIVRVAKMAGVSRVRFAESPILSVLGQDVALSDSNPVFAIDIGAGGTSLAAFSLDGVIAGISMNMGGNNMDVHIIDHIAELHNLKIGSLSSEKLKNTVGSLIEDDNQSAIVNGRDIGTGKPRSVAVYSPDIDFPIRVYVDKIVEYAEMLIKKLPAEVSAAIDKSGIYLSGGVANLAGIADYIGKKLQTEVRLADDPQMAVVLGGGRVVGNPALLKRVAMD